MSRLLADASALVSLGTMAGNEPDPLSMCLTDYDAVVPTAVTQELQETASYEDAHGRAATAVLERTESLETRSVSLDSGFPLDDGENATVTLANDIDAALVLCDDFTQLGLIHASLADTRRHDAHAFVGLRPHGAAVRGGGADNPRPDQREA